MPDTDIDSLRKRIDAVDGRLLELLEQRLGLVHQIGGLKTTADPHKARFGREALMIAPLAASAKTLPPAHVHYLFRHIINAFMSLEAPFRIRPLSGGGEVQADFERAVCLCFGLAAAPAKPCAEAFEELLDNRIGALALLDPRDPLSLRHELTQDLFRAATKFLGAGFGAKGAEGALILGHYHFEAGRLPAFFVVSKPLTEKVAADRFLWEARGRLRETETPKPPAADARLIGSWRKTVPLAALESF